MIDKFKIFQRTKNIEQVGSLLNWKPPKEPARLGRLPQVNTLT